MFRRYVLAFLPSGDEEGRVLSTSIGCKGRKKMEVGGIREFLHDLFYNYKGEARGHARRTFPGVIFFMFYWISILQSL